MALATMHDEVEEVRKSLDHPVIDADAHIVEYLPALSKFLAEEYVRKCTTLRAASDKETETIAGGLVGISLGECA